MGDNIGPQGISRADIARATTINQGAPLPNDTTEIVVAAYQNPQRARLSVAAFAVRTAEPKIRLLCCDQYPADYGQDRKADELIRYCQQMGVAGVALDESQNLWLAQRLIDAGIHYENSPLNAERRTWIAGDLIHRFREATIELYKDEALAKEISLLPIAEKATGYILEDSESLASLDRGMAFAIGCHWASGTLRDCLENPY